MKKNTHIWRSITIMNMSNENQITIGDSIYTLDDEFLMGCRDYLNCVSYKDNPFIDESKRDQWEYGHVLMSQLQESLDKATEWTMSATSSRALQAAIKELAEIKAQIKQIEQHR